MLDASPGESMVRKSGQRDYVVDLLRSFALACIVLAHCKLGGVAFQLRTFDVVCMAFLSGMSYRLSGSKGLGGWSQFVGYFAQRIKRLVFSTWKFLTMLFALELALAQFGLFDWVGWNTVKRSYLLLDGIGYVWIVRVYLLIALLAPALPHINRRMSSNAVFATMVTVLLLALSLLLAVDIGVIPQALRWYWSECLLYLLGYGIVAFVGYRHQQMSHRFRIGLALCLALYVTGFYFVSGRAALQDYKYPPHPYYICYGICVSLFLYELFSLPSFERIRKSKVVLFVSKNSLWLYLWHILPVVLLPSMLPRVDGADGFGGVLARWLICSCVAVVCTVLQNKVRSWVGSVSSEARG